MTAPLKDRHSDAQSGRITELREAGWTLRKIAAEIGVSYQAVRKVIDPDHAEKMRQTNARRAAIKRQWERENDRKACVICGGPRGAGAHRNKSDGRCGECRDRQDAERLQEALRLRREERMTNEAIAGRLGIRRESVATLLSRAKKSKGIDVPRAPYPKRKAAA